MTIITATGHKTNKIVINYRRYHVILIWNNLQLTRT